MTRKQYNSPETILLRLRMNSTLMVASLDGIKKDGLPMKDAVADEELETGDILSKGNNIWESWDE